MRFYRLSFTAANLMPIECKTLALQYAITPDWLIVSKGAISKNLLAKARSTSSIRQIHELISRLSNLTPELVFALPALRPLSAARLCFLATIKTYDIITDFMLEVFCPKWTERKDILRPAEFFDFFASKSITHPELSSISENTLIKLRQVLFFMLEQAGFLEKARSGKILPVHNDVEFLNLIKSENERYKRCLGV
jgi:hypothetical protein